MLNIYHFHTFPLTLWVIYPGDTELFQAWTSYRVIWLISGIYIYQDQEIMSFFDSAVKYLWSSNSGLFQIEALFIYFFFCFLKMQSRRKISKYFFFRNHAILSAIFGSQIRFDSQFQLREQIKKLLFSL